MRSDRDRLKDILKAIEDIEHAIAHQPECDRKINLSRTYAIAHCLYDCDRMIT
ncbi:MAG: hypothetical protein AB4352_24530 [Hormoscilla sp.]